jgi:hypothetical protein
MAQEAVDEAIKFYGNLYYPTFNLGLLINDFQ